MTTCSTGPDPDGGRGVRPGVRADGDPCDSRRSTGRPAAAARAGCCGSNCAQRGLDYLLTRTGHARPRPRLPAGRPRARRPRRGRPLRGAAARRRTDSCPERPSARASCPSSPRFVARHAACTLPELPEEETPSPLRRLAHGLRHARGRDAEAIHHHYDVVNDFYELRARPVDDLHLRVLPDRTTRPSRQAQEDKFDLVARKLGLEPGMRLLDVGCGWGGMVRHAVEHYGVTALGVTLSKEQATWAPGRIEAEGLDDRAEVRHADYRDVTERGFDAVSSIGLTEHIGVAQLPGLLPVPARAAARRGAAAQPLHHPPGQPAPGPAVARVHQPLRLPRRRAHRLGRHRAGHGGRGLRGAPPREPPRALRDDPRGLEHQPVEELGRLRRARPV